MADIVTIMVLMIAIRIVDASVSPIMLVSFVIHALRVFQEITVILARVATMVIHIV